MLRQEFRSHAKIVSRQLGVPLNYAEDIYNEIGDEIDDITEDQEVEPTEDIIESEVGEEAKGLEITFGDIFGIGSFISSIFFIKSILGKLTSFLPSFPSPLSAMEKIGLLASGLMLFLQSLMQFFMQPSQDAAPKCFFSGWNDEFEQGQDGWSFSGVARVTTVAHSGSYSVKFSNENDYMEKEIDCQTNKWFSFWFYLSPDWANADLDTDASRFRIEFWSAGAVYAYYYFKIDSGWNHASKVYLKWKDNGNFGETYDTFNNAVSLNTETWYKVKIQYTSTELTVKLYDSSENEIDSLTISHKIESSPDYCKIIFDQSDMAGTESFYMDDIEADEV